MAVVQDYSDLPLNNTISPPTFTLSTALQHELQQNGVTRPKGQTVSWHYNPSVEKHHFGQTHPMKPWRLTLTKSLVLSYGMHHAMDSYVSRAATKEELAEFHKDEYVDFLSVATPQNIYEMYPELATGTLGYSSHIFGVGDDCPYL